MLLLIRVKGRTYAACDAKYFVTENCTDPGGRAIPRDNSRLKAAIGAGCMLATLVGLLVALCLYLIRSS